VLAAVVLKQCQVTLIAVVVVVVVCVLDCLDDRVDFGFPAVLVLTVLGLPFGSLFRELTVTLWNSLTLVFGRQHNCLFSGSNCVEA
jgi:hypothetical protein